MASINAQNYKASRVDSPSAKYERGGISGKLKTFFDRVVLVDASGALGLNAADTVEFGYLPHNAIVLDAYLRINKSLGATGIFDLGYRAHTDLSGASVAADPNAFVSGANGGGQASVKRADVLNANAGLGKRFSVENQGEFQVYASCTEVMDDSVIDAVLEAVIFYVTD